MNYSVFKVQNQAGKPSIFWEKETVPKNDRKFGYKKREQRFPVRRFPGDKHYMETDLVSLTPDEPPPPPKPPAKNFIKRNKAKVGPKKDNTAGTVTLTQDQLNAILRSVGKVAGGDEHAVKISIDESKDKREILIESPRRHGDDDDSVDDHKERRRKKKSTRNEDQGNSIYNLMDGKSKASSDNESEGSVELRRLDHKHKHRRDRKSRRNDDSDNDEPRTRNRSKHRYDDDDVSNKGHRNRSNHDNEKKSRNNRSKDASDDLNAEIEALRQKAQEIEDLRKQAQNLDDDSDTENRKSRRRQNRSKTRDSDEEDLYTQDNDRRTRKSDKSRRDDRSKDRTRQIQKDRSPYRGDGKHNDSINYEEDAEQHSPRDKVGLPIDLSWKHMTKAERRRLEMARQKVIDEEEHKEEERIKQLNSRYAPAPPDLATKPSPQRHKPARSDPPATRSMARLEQGRETQTTNYTDNNRRGRRSRSPTPERSPDLPAYNSPDTSPKGPVGIPRRHMTLAEKKRMEWERERVESVAIQQQGTFDPWGRPGAGAPIRTKSGHVAADYKGRQENMHNHSTIPEEPSLKPGTSYEDKSTNERQARRHVSPPPATTHQSSTSAPDPSMPYAMRSSFVIGQSAPDVSRQESAKERERKQWLADLEAQIEEKRLKNAKPAVTASQETWADKLGVSHRPVPFPEQTRDPGGSTGAGDAYHSQAVGGGGVLNLESHRDAHSAPDGGSYIRGQNVPIDEQTKRELEDKRKRQLEHQAAVKAQVEEKERLRRQERERKQREDMEEERKLQAERDALKNQFESEQQKIKQKEQQRQAQVNQLKAAMDEAQAQAIQEKYERKMQHLEAGGHDTTKLREHLEGELTSRIDQLNTRRERDIATARKQMELKFWGIPEEQDGSKTDLHFEGQGHTGIEGQGHRESQNEADRNLAATPRSQHGMVVVEPTQIPGLDLYTARTQNPYNHPGAYTGQAAGAGVASSRRQPGTHHEPYQEDRVLTPTRLRHLSKPWSDPTSPRREFGTQTGKNTELTASASSLNVDDISNLLNPHINREESEVQIEYRYEKGKKVRVISAPKEALEKRGRKPTREIRDARPRAPSRNSVSPHEHHHEVVDKKVKQEELRKKRLEHQRRKGPVKPGSRPMWGYKNPDSKKPKKQSEKDPFFKQKQAESAVRKNRREKQLLSMVEANRDVIPDYYVPSERSARSREQSPHSDIENASPRMVKTNRRAKSHSPHHRKQQRAPLGDYLEVHAGQGRGRGPSQSPERSEPHNAHNDSWSETNVQSRPSRNSNNSPPIPALRHKHENTNQNQSDPRKRRGGRYGDVDPVGAPNGDFVPFTRTIDVLDPSKAEEPLPLSREATRVAAARKAYFEGLHPEKFGNKQYVYVDKHRVIPPGGEGSKDPMMNPSLVLDHPTSRQDQILVQLSTLKQSLMQRQRELETFSPTDLMRYNTGVNAT